jgi:hypothetical protein
MAALEVISCVSSVWMSLSSSVFASCTDTNNTRERSDRPVKTQRMERTRLRFLLSLRQEARALQFWPVSLAGTR